jgi:hypothetical protein
MKVGRNENIVQRPLAVASHSTTVHLLQEGNIAFIVPHIPRNVLGHHDRRDIAFISL